ncbi:hypothetical protein PENNAL_c0809G00498 [Penicillium nalgiovense]|uniref:Uncharacterized protein n=1 Tax=Penicillium nalgiovense TaxID=60175 RepID=A0A1V6UER6_PENNA|nr:hypothetical protein PENNAL_c0809G00498 [Penicillium nalgiovense]
MPIAATEQRDYETRKHSTTDKHQYREYRVCYPFCEL